MHTKLTPLLRLLTIVIVTGASIPAMAQAKLILHGGIILIDNGASLVIDNPDHNAIIRDAGYIQSEGEENKLIWSIGPGDGNSYLSPFGHSGSYFPVTFQASSGAGTNGRFVLTTYPTSTWKNSDQLPAGVTNANSAGVDNSKRMIDRFWRIEPQNYSQQPTLDNISFTYDANELTAPNTILEAALTAQRWNPSLGRWDDYATASVVDRNVRTVTVPSIPGTQLFNWWTLTDLSTPLPVTITDFSATVSNGIVITKWLTWFESNSDHFEVWRSNDGVAFNLLDTLPAKGYSNTIHEYMLRDEAPFAGTSYYKLKSVDKDGAFTWSIVVTAHLDARKGISLFPNPAEGYTIIHCSGEIIARRPVATLYDAFGRRISTFQLVSEQQVLSTATLAAGMYQIVIRYGNESMILRFIKR